MDWYFIMMKSGSTSIKGLEKAQNEQKETIFIFFFFSLSFFSEIRKADSRKGVSIKPLLAKVKGSYFLKN